MARMVYIEPMGVLIPDDILTAAGFSDSELKREVATLLYSQERLTLAQAARFAEMNRIQFQHLLASRDIPLHYGVEDFEDDLKTLRALQAS